MDVRAVEAALGTALEPTEDQDFDDRTHLRRFRTADGRCVVVKEPRGGARDAFLNEWASLQLLTELAPGVAPRFLGGDRDLGFLIMEDLGSGPGLDDALLGDDPARAADMLVGLFETVGRMHALTLGQRARFEALRGPVEREPSTLQDEVTRALSRLDIEPAPGFFAALEPPCDLDALVHGDPCPDNCRRAGDRVVLFDFEHARFGDPFTDGCYPRIHFPTCWCLNRLPDDVARRAVDAYRRALGLVDDFEGRMAAASARWAYWTFGAWHMPRALDEDSTWGLVTIRQRLRFRFGLLPGMLADGPVAETTRRVAAALAARWPDVPPVPLYPAFR